MREGWTRVTFGDVVRQVKDRVDPETSGLERYVAGEHMDTDDLRLRRWGTIGDGYLGPAFHMRFKPGHVLFGSRRTYLRKVALADFEGVTANTTFVVETKNQDALLSQLLPYLMQTPSFCAHSVKQSKGSVNPYINFSDLEWYEFQLPPLAAQQRLVEAYTALDSSVASLTTVVDRSGVVRRSLMRSIGADCASKRIGDLFEVASGGTPDRGEPRYWGGAIPWVKTGEVDFRLIQETDEFITDEGLRNSSAKVLPGNTVLIAMYGQGPTRGRVGILGMAASTNQACAALLPAEDFDPWFVFGYLESHYDALRAMAQGAAQPNLSLDLIKSFEMPLVPIEQQRYLAGLVRTLRNAADLASSRADQLRAWKGRLETEFLG